MHPARIFISYRRDDAAGYARAVYDELARQFGAERVFIDVDDIGAGLAFGQVIQDALASSRVLVVLIGRRWRGEAEGGPPRITRADDLVRREVATGLAQGAWVMPVLLDGAPMPTADQLPADLQALAGRNALELENTRYATDLQRLVAAVRQALGEPAGAGAASPDGAPDAARLAGMAGQGRRVVIGLAALAIALGLGWAWRAGPGAGGAAPKQAASGRPAVNGSWQAQVRYDWPNADYVERFDFRGEAEALHGSAGFLGVARGVLEGRVEPGALRFVTRTTEMLGSASLPVEHRYQARLVGDELHFVMQTEGGSTPHRPVEFVARRAAAAPER